MGKHTMLRNFFQNIPVAKLLSLYSVSPAFLTLQKYAGKDATEAYDPIHPPGIITENLTPDKHLGEVDMSTVIKDKVETDPEEQARLERIKNKPDLTECFNLLDFEVSSTVCPSDVRRWQDK